MRVLHVDSGRRWGGGQNQVRLLMRELRRAGIEQSCLCPEGSPLAARLAAEELPVVTARWRRGLAASAMLAIGREARTADVVHCHDAHALQLALLPAALLRRPVLAARRMSLPTSAAKWNRADRVIAVSAAVRDALRASGVTERRLRLIHSGIDLQEVASLTPERPSLRERLGLGRDVFLAGSIGALVKLKSQSLVVAAAALEAEQLSAAGDVRAGGTASAPPAVGGAVHWVVIGEGEARGELERAIAAGGVTDRVHLPGALPDARRVLREFDVFVFTSARDALGTSILDAMACGVPVIGPDAGGPGEVLRPVHQETQASLFAAGDAAALAARVEQVRRDEKLRERMVAAQRRRLEDFRIERCAAATLALYEEVLRE